MILCPLCENAQATGTNCEVCGMAFPSTLVGEAGHQDAPVTPMEGLELTALGDELAKTQTPALAVDAPCVWCRHVQVVGTICDRCGMQRHRGVRPQGWQQAGQKEQVGACGDCGLPGSQGGRCRGCGAKIPGTIERKSG